MPSYAPCATKVSSAHPDASARSAFSRARSRISPSSCGFANAGIFIAFILWTLGVLPWGLFAALAALPLLRRGAPPALQRLARLCITAYGRGVLFWLRPWLPVHIESPQLAAANAPCIIVANHQSFLDLYLLGAQSEANLCLVSKAWPYRLLFFFAPIMRLAGYVNVEKLPPEAVETVCLERLAQGATLVVFPEGRRTRDGALGRFRAGAFALACKANVPVIPMIMENSFVVFPAGARRFRPMPLRLRLLAPVLPQDFADARLPHRAMLRHVRELFLQNLQPPVFPKEDTCE